MIALTLFDRRTREAFTVVVPDGWEPDATVYDITRRVALPPGFVDPRHWPAKDMAVDWPLGLNSSHNLFRRVQDVGSGPFRYWINMGGIVYSVLSSNPKT